MVQTANEPKQKCARPPGGGTGGQRGRGALRRAPRGDACWQVQMELSWSRLRGLLPGHSSAALGGDKVLQPSPAAARLDLMKHLRFPDKKEAQLSGARFPIRIGFKCLPLVL